MFDLILSSLSFFSYFNRSLSPRVSHSFNSFSFNDAVYDKKLHIDNNDIIRYHNKNCKHNVYTVSSDFSESSFSTSGRFALTKKLKADLAFFGWFVEASPSAAEDSPWSSERSLSLSFLPPDSGPVESRGRFLAFSALTSSVKAETEDKAAGFAFFFGDAERGTLLSDIRYSNSGRMCQTCLLSVLRFSFTAISMIFSSICRFETLGWRCTTCEIIFWIPSGPAPIINLCNRFEVRNN